MRIFFLCFSLFNKVVYWVSGFWAFENDLDVNWRRVNLVNLYNHFYFFIIINTSFDWIYIYSINPSLFPLCSIIYPHFNNIYFYLFIYLFLSLLFFHYYYFFFLDCQYQFIRNNPLTPSCVILNFNFGK